MLSIGVAHALHATHGSCHASSHQGLRVVSICSAAARGEESVRRCPVAVAFCWPTHKLSICQARVRVDLRGGSQSGFMLGIGPFSESACASHMLCGCLP